MILGEDREKGQGRERENNERRASLGKCVYPKTIIICLKVLQL